MMHYRKGENIEQELSKDELPFEDCLSKLPQKEFLWMHVKGGTKVHNVLNYAKNALDKGEYRTIVWSGSGGGTVKTVSCAEILKRSYQLYQLTRMDQITIEEHWVPQMDGLEPIVAKRKVPSLHILMTLDPIDESIPEVQKPNTTTEYWRGSNEDTQQKKQRQRPGTSSDGQAQRQRYRKPKQERQGPKQENGEDVPTGVQRDRPQKSKNHPNKNRGPQRHERNGNSSGQQHRQEGQLQESPQQSQQQPHSAGPQERQQQSQRHRRPKPRPKQQHVPTTETGQMEAVPSTNTTTAGEPMES